MRKLGIWGGPVLVMMMVAGLAGPAASPALAQDQPVAWLGVSTQTLTEGLREGLDYEGEGVLVSQVVGNSPAYRGGIRKGDVILSVNSRRINSPDQLSEVVQSAKVGQTVSIALMRNGERRTVSAKLAERSSRSMSGSDFDDMKKMRIMNEDDFKDMEKEMRRHADTHTYTFRSSGRGRLGVRVQSLDGDLGSYFDAPDGKGVLITEVVDDSPADRAGLKAGDVITEVGGRKISDYDDLVDVLRDRDEGNVSVTVMRKGSRKTVQAELEDVPEPMWMGMGNGRGMTIVRPHDSEMRRRSQDSSDSEELRQLREEVRQLREKLNDMDDDD
jgi:serine protease Do